MKKFLALFLLLPSLAFAQSYNPAMAPPAVTGNTPIPTYSASIAGLANTGTGDLYCISGSATKTVKVKGIRVSAIATAAITISASIVKRNTAASGGTSTTPTIVPSDSLNAAGTAVVRAYTVSPTPGALVGQIRSEKLSVGTQGSNNNSDTALFQFSVYWDQPQVLRGVAESLCVTAPIAAGAGASFDIDHEHTEE